MIWKRWHWWNWIVRRLALAQGFLDPIAVFSSLQKFSKPSEVWAPTELLRSGMILQARGVVNSQAIQHNLDWVWPYWVYRQFNPLDKAFIPRAFHVAHINLTHRNWTAVGLPDCAEYSIVDPRGLVTPHFDGWSVDAWVVSRTGSGLLPARCAEAEQEMSVTGPLTVTTRTEEGDASLLSVAEVVLEDGKPVCKIRYEAQGRAGACVAVSLRPYNPEGVSFIHSIRRFDADEGWQVDRKHSVRLSEEPARYVFSTYAEGDVYSKLFNGKKSELGTDCEVGMATAAALYEIPASGRREITVSVPLTAADKKAAHPVSWEEEGEMLQQIRVPDERFRFLHEAALRTMILHCPAEVYPGPYTYRRFWFRDAAFILNAMATAGMTERVERALDKFHSRQLPTGYFLSQDGEWDSNGEALWAIHRFCSVTHRKPKAEWLHSIRLGARWIQRKRTAKERGSRHSGLLPAGFSAEHLGPNDFYYWDDFWGIAGLRAGAHLLSSAGEKELAEELFRNADDLACCVDQSLEGAASRLDRAALMPASPYRRMDAGAIGSLAAGYPLHLMTADDPRTVETARYLLDKCFVLGGFYQEISHSGINAYLTLHVAQVLLRAGDPRFFEIMKAIASMASPTGQWPEAIHPGTGGGCMGDGQHVWAAAEWVMMMRSLFVREEEPERLLVLGAGIPEEWLAKEEKMFFGPTLTAFGEISVTIEGGKEPCVSWEARWHGEPPRIEVHLPGCPKFRAADGSPSLRVRREGSS